METSFPVFARIIFNFVFSEIIFASLKSIKKQCAYLRFFLPIDSVEIASGCIYSFIYIKFIWVESWDLGAVVEKCNKILSKVAGKKAGVTE